MFVTSCHPALLPARLAGTVTLLQDSPLPSWPCLQQHWLARLPSQIRLIVRFNKVLPLCDPV